MATQFQITESTKRTSMNIGGVPIVIGQKYDISLQSQIKIINDFGFPAEPIDSFKYKIIQDGLSSVNEETVKINFKTDKTTVPNLIEINKAINVFDQFLFSDLVLGSNLFDRITITEISGKGSWILNSAKIQAGQTFFYYEIYKNLYYIANEQGAANDYATLKFKFGNIYFTFDTDNYIKVNTKSKAILSKDDSIDITDFETYEEYTADITVENGFANADFKIEIDTLNFIGIGVNPETSVLIEVNDTQRLISTSTITQVTKTLDLYGGSNIRLYIRRKKDTENDTFLEVNLIEVNNSSDNVDLQKKSIRIDIPKTVTI